MRIPLVFAMAMVLLLCPPARAEETISSPDMQLLRAELEQFRKELHDLHAQHEKEVIELQGQIRELADEMQIQRETQEAEKEAVYHELYQEAPSPIYQALPASGQALGQIFNPDISVIGDVLAQYTDHENDGDRPDDEFIFRELEINFSGVLDPFARADVVVGIHKDFAHHEHDEETGDDHEHEHICEGRPECEHAHDYAIDVEEAYLTTLSLPHGLQARVGRMRERFGKVNAIHMHALPSVDYPLVIKNYFGGHGLVGDGAELSWLAPTQHYLELVYEVFNNSNGSSFAGEHHDDFVHLAHAKNLFELSDSSTIEFGGTIATGPNDDGHGGSRTWLEGLDLTYKWRPLEEGLYKGISWQSEVLFSQKDTHEGEMDTWGMYSSLEYQFGRRWKTALRYDYSEFPDCEKLHEHGYSAYLTFLQSEYVFWRFGYMLVDRNFDDPVDSGQENEHLLWVQLNFGLGPHRAHAY